MTETTGEEPKGAGKASAGRPLPKRFYSAATVAGPDVTGAALAEGFGILLDAKPVRTPAKAMFAVPTRALAAAIAAEWEAQGAHIDPASMPLTKIANSAIDGVRGREAAVRDDLVKYAASDLVCYRASQPELLVRRQADAWDPVLAWGRDALGVRFATAVGIMPVVQPREAKSAVLRALEGYNAFALAALHVITTLTGSALLALAHARGRLSADEAWAAAHIDKDWQVAQWGEDAEASARRQRRWAEMRAASRLLELLRLG